MPTSEVPAGSWGLPSHWPPRLWILVFHSKPVDLACPLDLSWLSWPPHVPAQNKGSCLTSLWPALFCYCQHPGGTISWVESECIRVRNLKRCYFLPNLFSPHGSIWLHFYFEIKEPRNKWANTLLLRTICRKFQGAAPRSKLICSASYTKQPAGRQDGESQNHKKFG